MAVREIARSPVGFIEQVLEYRAFARAHRDYERASADDRMKGSKENWAFKLLWEFEFARAGERLKRLRK